MTRLDREISVATTLLREAMAEQGVSLDNCLSVCAVLVTALRELGWRAEIVPVRVRLLIPGGKAEYANIGYAEPEDGRYNGHVLVVVERKIAVDPTIAQLGGPWKRGAKDDTMLFDVDRDFMRGEPTRMDYKRWQVIFEKFNDGGAWSRDMNADVSRLIRENGKALARRVRPPRS